jgi:hypothetical protein
MYYTFPYLLGMFVLGEMITVKHGDQFPVWQGRFCMIQVCSVLEKTFEHDKIASKSGCDY